MIIKNDMESNKFYPFKVWLTTIVASPILYNIVIAIRTNTQVEDIRLIMAEIFVGLLVSVPTFLIYFLLFTQLNKNINSFNQKLILALTVIICLLITFLIIAFGKSIDFNSYLFIITYVVCVILFSFIYKIKKVA